MINPSSLKLQTYLIRFNILALTTFFSLFITTFLFSKTFSPSLFASEQLINSGHDSNKSHQIKPLDEWTPQEKWVWNCIAKGENADFNKSENCRVLQSKFLETILLCKSYRSAISLKGVHISGAVFTEPIDLSNSFIDFPLYLLNCQFEKDVNFNWLKSSSVIYLDGSKFVGKLSMIFLEIDKSLYLNNGAEFSVLDLSAAKIGKQLSINNSKFKSELIMRSLEVKRDLIMRNNLILSKTDLDFAKIFGNLEIDGCKFSNSGFYSDEFKMSLTIESLCDAINNDKFNLPLNIPNNSISFLNDLLEVPNFYDILLSKYHNIPFSMRVMDLVYKTDSYRNNTNFSNLNLDQQNYITRLNRFLLEETYPEKTPKSDDRIPFDMNTLKVGNYLILQGNSKFFCNVNLLGSEINNQVIITNCKFEGDLIMDSIAIHRDLIMRGNLEFFKIVDIHNAVIDKELEINGAAFHSLLSMNHIKIKRNLTIQNSNFKKHIEILFSNIDKNLEISNGYFPSVYLDGSQINGQLLLVSQKDQPAHWHEEAILSLHNTKVLTFQDLPYSWPDELELDGFTYQLLGGFKQKKTDDIKIVSRDSTWFLNWLEKQKKYTPQPYEQLASILQKAGYKEKASDILYESKERERKEIAKGWYKLWLFFLNWLIGYGLGLRLLYLPLFWVMIFTVIGMFCINKHKKEKERFIHKKKNVLKEKERYKLWYSCWNSWYLWCFFYSFDILLPLFKLDKQHNNIELEGCQRYYFYFHKIFGFTLTSFIIAGITGLTR